MAATRKATPIKRMGDDAAMLDKIKKEGGENLTAYAHEPVWERYRGKQVILEALNGSGLGFQGTRWNIASPTSCCLMWSRKGGTSVRRDLSTVRHILR